MGIEQSDSFIKRWADKQQKLVQQPIISVVIPAYNESYRIPATLLDTCNYLKNSIGQFEVYVVDDGSSDDTALVVNRFASLVPEVKLLQLANNQGKGAAIRAGVLQASGNFILCIDADGATPITELERLLVPIEAGEAEIAFGSRALEADQTRVNAKFHRKMLGRLFNLAVNFILIPNVQDTQCGFKLLKKSTAQFLCSRQKCLNFAFDVEWLYIAHKAQITVKEVAINWTDIPGTKVNVLIDGVRMFTELFKIRSDHASLTPGDYKAYKQSIK